MNRFLYFSGSNEYAILNSPTFDECQSQLGEVAALPWEQAYPDDSKDYPQHNPRQLPAEGWARIILNQEINLQRILFPAE